MKKHFPLIALLMMAQVCLQAQNNPVPPVDRSPLDLCYYPVNYPVLKIQDKATEPLVARVLYSRPQKAGRSIFNGLVKYGEVWRMGANEATEIEFFKTVRVANKKVLKGRYTLYAITGENNWTLIINKETDTWGSFKYDIKKDLLRTDVPVQKTDAAVESLSMYFEKTTTGCNLVITWDTVKAALPITF